MGGSSSSTTSASHSSSETTGMKLTLSTIRSKFSDVNQLSTDELHKLLNNDSASVLLLDTRPEQEFAVSHLQDAVRVPPEMEDEEVFTKLLEKLNGAQDRHVVCYCSLGYRSCIIARRVSKLLATAGLPEPSNKDIRVWNLDGSLFKWANEARAMIDDTGRPTICAHPYNALFGRLLKSSLRCSTLPKHSEQSTKAEPTSE